MNKVKFAFYFPGASSRQLPPCAAYVVLETDDPELMVGGHFSADTLIEHGIEIPFTPSYEAWMAMGSPMYRSEKR